MFLNNFISGTKVLNYFTIMINLLWKTISYYQVYSYNNSFNYMFLICTQSISKIIFILKINSYRTVFCRNSFAKKKTSILENSTTQIWIIHLKTWHAKNKTMLIHKDMRNTSIHLFTNNCIIRCLFENITVRLKKFTVFKVNIERKSCKKG